MNRKALYGLAVLLALVGLVPFFYKVLVLGFPLRPTARADRWDVEMQVRFRAAGGPVKVEMAVPRTAGRFAVIDEHFVSERFGLTTSRTALERRATWSIRDADGEQVLYYRGVVQRFGQSERERSAPLDVDVPDLDELHLTAALGLLAESLERSADLETLIAQLMSRLNRPGANSNAALLLGTEPTMSRRVEVAVDVLALDGVPARQLKGLRLERRGRKAVSSWLEVFDGRQWLPFDPATGLPGVPDDYLVLTRSGRVLRSSGTEGATIHLAVRRSQHTGVRAAESRARLISPTILDWSLLSLPLATQEVYRVLLLVPVGAFLLVLLRTLVGVKTFGTFMPVLIGLAFRETRLAWGVLLFTLVVGLGLAARFYLERLRLMIVPRLAAVLIVVILVMMSLSIVSHRLGFETGLSVALFPMVILAITIERMSVVWDELGAATALAQGLGTLIVAVLSYGVMVTPLVNHLVFLFPELLLTLLAAILVLGRYSGYRLLELRRFRDLARQIGE